MESIPQECAYRPWGNWLIVFSNVAVYLWQWRDPALMSRGQLNGFSSQVWPFITYAFLHVAWWHLLTNLGVLLLLGGAVNEVFGQLGYLAFYLGAAVCSGIGFVAADGEAVVGASGAAGGVMGAFMVLHPASKVKIWLIFSQMPVRSMYLVMAFLAYNLVMSFAGSNSVQHVAYEAHAAGTVFGIVVCIAMLLSGALPRLEMDLLEVLKRSFKRRQKHPSRNVN